MKKIIAFTTLLFFTLLIAQTVFAQTTPAPSTGLLASTTDLSAMTAVTANQAGLSGMSVSALTGQVLKVVLSLLGLIFLILVIFAGYNWMTASGNEEKVKKSTGTIKSAVIGLIIVIAAYIITLFIFQSVDMTGIGPGELAEGTAAQAGLSSGSIGPLIAQIIRGLLGLLGAIFIILMIVAGFSWMTAGGNEEQVKKSTSIIKSAVIGLVIVLAAYAVTYFLFTYLPFFGSGMTIQGGTSG